MTNYDTMIERLRAEPWAILHDAADMMVAMKAENEQLTYDLQVIEENHFQLKKERDALQAKMDELGKGEPVGFVAPHDLKTLREGYPATVVMLPSNKRTEPLYAAPKALAPEPLTEQALQVARLYFGYAKGHYMGMCSRCNEQMDMVDKRCSVCVDCADKAIAAHGIGGTP